MPASELHLVKSWIEFQPKEDRKILPEALRGIYVLYNHNRRTDRYDVV